MPKHSGVFIHSLTQFFIPAKMAHALRDFVFWLCEYIFEKYTCGRQVWLLL